jgi:hypothetical protein
MRPRPQARAATRNRSWALTASVLAAARASARAAAATVAEEMVASRTGGPIASGCTTAEVDLHSRGGAAVETGSRVVMVRRPSRATTERCGTGVEAAEAGSRCAANEEAHTILVSSSLKMRATATSAMTLCWPARRAPIQ